MLGSCQVCEGNHSLARDHCLQRGANHGLGIILRAGCVNEEARKEMHAGPFSTGAYAPGSPPLPRVSAANGTDIPAQALHKDMLGLKTSR